MTVRWVVQTNLGKHYSEDLRIACSNLGLPFVPEHAIPFSDEIPDIDSNLPTVFYGATRWINNIYASNKWEPGVFFNPRSVFTRWSKKYDKHVLNADAKITTLIKLAKESRPDHELIFVRPVSDQKEFAGNVMSFKNIKCWKDNLITDVDTADFGNIPIVASEPVGIAHEWRLFIVNGKVSSGSHYRKYHKLKEDPYVPPEVIKFAEARCYDYMPTPVFVMDIGESAGNLYIIEIGCFNSAGFYASDVEKIVRDVSNYIEE